MKITDLKNMPNFNLAAPNGADSVENGKVFLGSDGKPECHQHKAMNCVSQDRRIWRCLMCNEGCYVIEL